MKRNVKSKKKDSMITLQFYITSYYGYEFISWKIEDDNVIQSD